MFLSRWKIYRVTIFYCPLHFPAEARISSLFQAWILVLTMNGRNIFQYWNFVHFSTSNSFPLSTKFPHIFRHFYLVFADRGIPWQTWFHAISAPEDSAALQPLLPAPYRSCRWWSRSTPSLPSSRRWPTTSTSPTEGRRTTLPRPCLIDPRNFGF